MGLGVWALVNKSSFLDILDQANVSVPIYESAVVLFLVVASGSILISCLGCCGAYKESKWMLIVVGRRQGRHGNMWISQYFVVVLGLLVLITVGAIIGFTQVPNCRSHLGLLPTTGNF